MESQSARVLPLSKQDQQLQKKTEQKPSAHLLLIGGIAFLPVSLQCSVLP